MGNMKHTPGPGKGGKCQECEKLKQELTETRLLLCEYKKALEFYANPESWILEQDTDVRRRIAMQDMVIIPKQGFVGGLTARQALAKTPEGKKND